MSVLEIWILVTLTIIFNECGVFRICKWRVDTND